MVANKSLDVILLLLSPILVPLQLLSTFILGTAVNLTFGLLILPISLIWLLLFLPLVGLSWLSGRIPFSRNLIGFLGLPWAVLAEAFVILMPSMGELENRTWKLLLCGAWPFTFEFLMFTNGHLQLDDEGAPTGIALNSILIRIAPRNTLQAKVVEKIQRDQILSDKATRSEMEAEEIEGENAADVEENQAEEIVGSENDEAQESINETALGSVYEDIQLIVQNGILQPAYSEWADRRLSQLYAQLESPSAGESRKRELKLECDQILDAMIARDAKHEEKLEKIRHGLEDLLELRASESDDWDNVFLPSYYEWSRDYASPDAPSAESLNKYGEALMFRFNANRAKLGNG